MIEKAEIRERRTRARRRQTVPWGKWGDLPVPELALSRRVRGIRYDFARMSTYLLKSHLVARGRLQEAEERKQELEREKEVGSGVQPAEDDPDDLDPLGQPWEGLVKVLQAEQWEAKPEAVTPGQSSWEFWRTG